MNMRPRIVIVAEDELIIRMMVAEALTDAGFHVIEVEHAEAALTILHSNASNIRAIFTDVHMPGSIDGLELARQASLHWPWIALLVASGRAQPQPAEMPAGSRFLPKPYQPAHVVSCIQDLVAAE
jgi:CheY-like chemotaxis protein